MARATTTTKAAKPTKPAPTSRKPARASVAVSKKPAKVRKAAAPERFAVNTSLTSRRKTVRASKSVAAVATKAAKSPQSKIRAVQATTLQAEARKDELVVQVDKLERTVANLRDKSSEATKLIKAAGMQLAELEARIANLEDKMAATSTPSVSPVEIGTSEPHSYEVEPVDAVPPGVAVQGPTPMDGEALAAMENLEEHLRNE